MNDRAGRQPASADRSETSGQGVRPRDDGWWNRGSLRELSRRLMDVSGWLRAMMRRHSPTVLGWLARVFGPWRRSLQLRVVSITLLVSSLLVMAFGYFVAKQITAGLLVAKREAAVRQVRSGVSRVQQQMSAFLSPDDPELGRTVRDVVVTLANLPTRAGTYEVKLVPEPPMSVQAYGAPAETDQIVVPRALSRVVSEQGALAYQFTVANPDGGARRPYLMVGMQADVGWGVFDLYYQFPLDDEVAAANLVRTTMGAAGVALVLLLALVAAIVTRMVVAPVRAAASTAQRLSAGLLHERMEVRGEDDLARLAASFNQMASNLQSQIVRLEELSRLQRRFTSDVSHELRTPLTTVRMAADMLYAGRDDFPPATARSAELLADELDRFEALLTDLLEISRFDAGFAVLDSEPVDLVPIVHRVADGFSVLAERLRCPVEVTTPAGPMIAEVDPRRVERVLRNLIGNAIEHGEHRPVQVRLELDDRAVAIVVRDHGIGLKPGEEKLVFNRFWRADPSRARQTGGTGLGLSISLEDARLHGGWLEAWGAPGQGSQFRLTLPVRAGDRLLSSPQPLVPSDAQIHADLPFVLPAGHSAGAVRAGTAPRALAAADQPIDPSVPATGAADPAHRVGSAESEPQVDPVPYDLAVPSDPGRSNDSRDPNGAEAAGDESIGSPEQPPERSEPSPGAEQASRAQRGSADATEPTGPVAAPTQLAGSRRSGREGADDD